ncbi:MAG: serine/threonine-protein kinase [Cyanobacteria bacterium J06623_7]
MPENLVGKTIRQHYSLVKRLSRDDLSAIYLARDTFSAIGGKYIVRHYYPCYEHEAQLAAATSLFTQEAEKLQQLGNHPQIPRLHDFFVLDNHFFIVQEFIEGQNLREELSEVKLFPRSQIIKLLTDVLRALEFVHNSGAIHGDIQPNSLIRNQFDLRIFLQNFIALPESIAPPNIDKSGEFKQQIIYSPPEYTAPERSNFEPKFSSDIYALGIVAIEAMTGTSPANLVRDNHARLQWRDRLDGQYDARLLEIIEQMVEIDWCDRYADAATIIADLEQLSSSTADVTKTNQPLGVTAVAQKSRPISLEKSGSCSKQNSIKQNFSKIIAGLSAISISLVAWWQLKQLQMPELNTYDNEYVRLKYPADWSKQERDGFSNTSVILTSPKESTGDRFQERIAVIVEESSRPISLSEYTNQALIQINSLNNTMISPPKPTVLDSSDGKFVIYEGLDKGIPVKRQEVWTVNYKQVYTIIYTAEPDKFKRFLPQVEQIVESIEIL